MQNYREKQEAVTREVVESLNSLRSTAMRAEADKLEAVAQLAKVEAENIVLKAQLAAMHQDITFEADFEIDEPVDAQE